MEINLEDGAIRELQTIDTDKNYLLKIVDDKYLIYVEQKSERKKSNRVYCMNLETGQKKYIYKADKRIIGIIVEWKMEGINKKMLCKLSNLSIDRKTLGKIRGANIGWKNKIV